MIQQAALPDPQAEIPVPSWDPKTIPPSGPAQTPEAGGICMSLCLFQTGRKGLGLERGSLWEAGIIPPRPGPEGALLNQSDAQRGAVTSPGDTAQRFRGKCQPLTVSPSSLGAPCPHYQGAPGTPKPPEPFPYPPQRFGERAGSYSSSKNEAKVWWPS